MQEIIACDSYGNSLTNLVQWDSDVYVYLNAEEIDSAYRTHFFNNTMDEAMVVESEYSGGVLKAKIPNALLMQPYIIVGYVEVTKNGETKSLYGFKINVRKKPKPSDYITPDTRDWIEAEDLLKECREYADRAFKSAENAKQSEDNASVSAKESAKSASNAKQSESAVAKSESNAKQSENNAAASAMASADSAANAKESERSAATSAAASASSAANAQNSETAAAKSEANAKKLEEDSAQYAKESKNSAKEAESFFLLSKSYAVGEGGGREGESTDNAKYYCELSQINAETSTVAAQESERAKETAEESARNAAESAFKAGDYMESVEHSAQEASNAAEMAEQIADRLQNLARWTNMIIDDVTQKSYFIGIENGVVYFSDEFEQK